MSREPKIRHIQMAVEELVDATANYCSRYKDLTDMPVGQDAIMSGAVASIIEGIRGLLQGEIGNANRGEMNEYLSTIASDNNVKLP